MSIRAQSEFLFRCYSDPRIYTFNTGDFEVFFGTFGFNTVASAPRLNSKASRRSLKLTGMVMLPAWPGDSTPASLDMSASVAIFIERDHARRQR